MLDIHRIAIWYRYKTCAEMAFKYGVSHDTMRRFVSDMGIADPKLDIMHHDRERAFKYRVQYRWPVNEIAEYLGRSVLWVKRTLRKAKRSIIQKMRVVYSRFRRGVQLSLFNDCVQLELFPELNHQRIAA